MNGLPERLQFEVFYNFDDELAAEYSLSSSLVAAGKSEYIRADLYEALEARVTELTEHLESDLTAPYLAGDSEGYRRGLEEAAMVLDRHESVPCTPAFPEAWTEKERERYEAGQIDASISWQAAIRALKENPIPDDKAP